MTSEVFHALMLNLMALPQKSPVRGKGQSGVRFEMIINISNIEIFALKFEFEISYWTALIY